MVTEGRGAQNIAGGVVIGAWGRFSLEVCPGSTEPKQVHHESILFGEGLSVAGVPVAGRGHGNCELGCKGGGGADA